MYKFMDQETAMKKALRTERQEGIEEGIEKGIEKGGIQMLGKLVSNGLLTMAEAAKSANISISEFQSRLAALAATE